jgi:hypothetical protein
MFRSNKLDSPINSEGALKSRQFEADTRAENARSARRIRLIAAIENGKKQNQPPKEEPKEDNIFIKAFNYLANLFS